MDKRNGKRPNMKDPGRFDYEDKELLSFWGYLLVFLFFILSIGVVIWLI